MTSLGNLELRQAGRLRVGRCPFHQDTHGSFTVYPDDSYHCFGCGRHGWLNDRKHPQPSPRPVEPPLLPVMLSDAGVRRAEGHPRAVAYFMGRGLWRETIARFRLGFDGTRYVIPCYRADGTLAGIKRRRAFDYDTGPKYLHVRGSVAAIFNEAALVNDDVVVCEGEIDTMTLAQTGIAAVCSTAGCAHFADAWLPGFASKRVTVWLDADPPGRAAALRLAQRLDGVAAEVRIVQNWPFKDVNEGATHS